MILYPQCHDNHPSSPPPPHCASCQRGSQWRLLHCSAYGPDNVAVCQWRLTLKNDKIPHLRFARGEAEVLWLLRAATARIRRGLKELVHKCAPCQYCCPLALRPPPVLAAVELAVSCLPKCGYRTWCVTIPYSSF